MNSMLNKISTILFEQDINFDVENQHVQCFAHIINLAVQKFIKNISVFEPNNENDIENDEETEIKLNNVIYKVSLLYFINILLFKDLI